ncbi:MAG: glycosyltransferase 87 family protein, partial [Verrucomicrobiota bacterium]
ILPVMVGAVLLALKQQPIRSGLLLGIAVGTKLCPLILTPLLFRPWLTRLKSLFPALLVFGAAIGLGMLPLYLGGLDETSGFVRYGKTWEMNDGIFLLLLGLSKSILGIANPADESVQMLARIMVIISIWVMALACAIKKPPSAESLVARCLAIMAFAFMFSPTQFPWYFIWSLPFLTLYPNRALLLLTALLPMYYLRFYFEDIGQVDFFDNRLVWAQYVPVLALLAWDGLQNRKKRTADERS